MMRRDLLRASLFAAAAGCVSAGATAMRSFQERAPSGRDAPLQHLPKRILGWRLAQPRTDMIDPIEIDPAFAAALSLYDRVVAHDYLSATGPRIMVNIAYKEVIEQENRFHWPELCYATQGFRVTRLPPVVVGAAALETSASRFIGERFDRTELVCYLMRVGGQVTVGSTALRTSLLRQNFAMQIPDGTLTRTSIIIEHLTDQQIEAATGELLAFTNGLLAAGGPALRKLIVA